MKRLVVALAALLAILAIAGLCLRWNEPLRLLLTGHVGGCSIAGALNAEAHTHRQEVTAASLRTQSHLMSRDSELYEHWMTPDGGYWIPKGTDLFFVLGEQERDLYENETVRVKPNDIVLDCGANVGVFVRKALRRQAAIVVAIEPVPRNLEALRRTFRNEIAEGRVVVYPKGVWDTTTTVRMWTYPNSVLDSFVMGSRRESATSAVPVDLPLTTIDELVADLHLPRVDFLKMDIEGAERRALRGGRETIARFKPRLAVATENLADDYLELPRVVADLEPGYRFAFGACTLLPDRVVRPEVAFFWR